MPGRKLTIYTAGFIFSQHLTDPVCKKSITDIFKKIIMEAIRVYDSIDIVSYDHKNKAVSSDIIDLNSYEILQGNINIYRQNIDINFVHINKYIDADIITDVISRKRDAILISFTNVILPSYDQENMVIYNPNLPDYSSAQILRCTIPVLGLPIASGDMSATPDLEKLQGKEEILCRYLPASSDRPYSRAAAAGAAPHVDDLVVSDHSESSDKSDTKEPSKSRHKKN